MFSCVLHIWSVYLAFLNYYDFPRFHYELLESASSLFQRFILCQNIITLIDLDVGYNNLQIKYPFKFTKLPFFGNFLLWIVLSLRNLRYNIIL